MTVLHPFRSRPAAALTLVVALGLVASSPLAWGQSQSRAQARAAHRPAAAPAATAGAPTTPPPAATTRTTTATTTAIAAPGVPPLLAAPAPAQTAAAQAEAADSGFSLTVKTEEESPFSIVIAPWIKSTPRADLERPARIYDEAAEPIDPDVFARRVDYYEKIYAVTEPRRAAAAGAERRAAATPVGTGAPTNAAGGAKSSSGFGSLFNFGPTIAAPRASPAAPARPNN